MNRPSLNRIAFQELARIRRQEARALVRAKMPAGAYYLAGYAVECALKARIAKATRRHDFPEKERVNQSHVHKLTDLLKLTGLQTAFDQAAKASPALERNWAIVKDWTETSRYDGTISMRKARELYRAVTARRTGVLQWLRQNW